MEYGNGADRQAGLDAKMPWTQAFLFASIRKMIRCKVLDALDAKDANFGGERSERGRWPIGGKDEGGRMKDEWNGGREQWAEGRKKCVGSEAWRVASGDREQWAESSGSMGWMGCLGRKWVDRAHRAQAILLAPDRKLLWLKAFGVLRAHRAQILGDSIVVNLSCQSGGPEDVESVGVEECWSAGSEQQAWSVGEQSKAALE